MTEWEHKTHRKNPWKRKTTLPIIIIFGRVNTKDREKPQILQFKALELFQCYYSRAFNILDIYIFFILGSNPYRFL